MAIRVDNLKRVREKLGKSQSEFSALLGISTRAVQSYEQGWRTVPPHVQKQVAMLLYLEHRKTHKEVPPCWELNGCTDEARQTCHVSLTDSGHICWLVSGNINHGAQERSWKAKWAKCLKCPVTTPWLKDA
jgi:DNA-binding XRE family transcriptional regulator